MECGREFPTSSSETVRPEDWTLLEVSAPAPDGAVEFDIGLYFNGEGSAWWDDAQVEIAGRKLELKREPITEVAPLEGGARGVVARIGERSLALITGGEPVQVGGDLIAHDGAFLALAPDDDDRRYVYLQAGRSVQVEGETMLEVQGERPLTVAIWWGDEPGTLHIRAQDSLAPHAPALEAGQVRLTIRAMDRQPITRAFVGDVEVPVARDGERYDWVRAEVDRTVGVLSMSGGRRAAGVMLAITLIAQECAPQRCEAMDEVGRWQDLRGTLTSVRIRRTALGC